MGPNFLGRKHRQLVDMTSFEDAVMFFGISGRRNTSVPFNEDGDSVSSGTSPDLGVGKCGDMVAPKVLIGTVNWD